MCDTALLKNQYALCLSCLVEFEKLKKEVDSSRVQQKFSENLFLESIQTLTHYPDFAKTLLKVYKYEGNLTVGDFYAEQVYEQLLKSGQNLNEIVLVPVPMHRFKIWIRGFNQTTYICDYLARKYKIKTEDRILKRISLGKKFAGSSRIKRINTISEYYDVTFIPECENKHLIIFDDVITTGSTMQECIKMMRKIGYKKMGIFALVTV